MKRIIKQELIDMAVLHMSYAEMADVFGVTVQELKSKYGPLIKKKRIETQQAIKHTQLKTALKGDRVMLQLLGQELLGQGQDVIDYFDNLTLNLTVSEVREIQKAASISTNSKQGRCEYGE